MLLAEDSGAARILTAALLSRMGCTVDAVEHGEDAVLCARTKDYDIIVLDIEMPGANGFDILQTISIESRPAIVFSCGVTAIDTSAT